jgi:hypothetical protein
MTEPTERPGEEIRAGDRVKLRSTGEEGEFAGMLEAGTNMLTADSADAMPWPVARVKLAGKSKPVAVPLADLIKMMADDEE